MDLDMDDDWEEWHPSKGSFLHHTIAGSAAGVSEHLLMFPVDTYKTYAQFGRSSTTPTFRSLLATEGFFRLWRGSPVILLACIPSHTAYFNAYELGKVWFGADKEGHHPVAAAGAGALATILHDAVMTPMDVVKQRLQLGYYSGIGHAMRSIAAQEGVRGFFASYPTTLLMNIPYAATAVATNESMRKLLGTTGTSNLDFLKYMLSGAVAGAVAAAATCPMDVVKTRLQTYALQPLGATTSTSAATAAAAGAAATASAKVPEMRARPAGFLPAMRAQFAQLYTASSASARPTSLSVLRSMLAEEGWRSLFRGVRARMLVHAPSQAISWGTYELVKSFLISGRLLPGYVPKAE